MEQMQFPRHLDAPKRFLFWTFPDLIPFAGATVMGMLLESLMTGMLIGAVAAWGFARFRDTKPDGYLNHIAYWYAGMPLKGRTGINSFIRQVYPT